MKYCSLFALAYLLNRDMALGSKLPANCATTTVLSVITTTMCSAGSPAVPTALMTGSNGNVPDQYSQPASAPSAVIPGSPPHVSMSHGSGKSPSAGTNENTAKESEALQTGAVPHTGEVSGATQAVKPTTAPAVGAGASASNDSSEPNPIASGQASSVTEQDSTATGTTSETSETPEAPGVVSGASSSETNVRVNAMIVAGIVACFSPMMIHL